MQTVSMVDLINKKFVGTDDLRKRLTEILIKLPKIGGKVIITQHGKPKGALLDIESYLEYEELLEQIADSDPKLIRRVNAALADVRKNGGVPAEEVFKQLGI